MRSELLRCAASTDDALAETVMSDLGHGSGK